MSASKEKPQAIPETEVLGHGKRYFIEFDAAWYGLPSTLLIVRLSDGRAAALDPKRISEIQKAAPPDFDIYCEEMATLHGQRQHGVDFEKYGVFGPMYDGADTSAWILRNLLGEVAA
jgi:hypothetical protein